MGFARERRVLRTVAKIFAAIVAVVVVGWAGLRFWVGTDAGHQVVERKVDEKVAEHAGGHVRLGAISGSLVAGATVDGVEWRDDAGGVVLKARKLVARWSAAKALAKRPELELRVEGLDVDADRLGGLDLEEAARALGEHVGDEVTIGRLEIVDGRVRGGGKRLDGLQLTGHAEVAKAQRLGDRGEIVLDELKGSVGGVPVSAAGAVRWDSPAGSVVVSALGLHVGASGVVADGRVAADGVDLRLGELRVAPEDLRRLSPQADAPRKPIVGSARAHGPLRAVVIDGTIRPDRGRIVLDGKLDVPARRGQLTVELDGAGIDFAPVVVTGKLALRGAPAEKGFAIDWHAEGEYQRREIDPNLPPSRRRAYATLRPGGRFQGKGALRLDPSAPSAKLDFHLTLDDPGQAARLLAGPDLAASPRPLVVDGEWRAGPDAPPRLTVRSR